MKVSILLSTYNGELYLTEQLESIISQTYSNWFLYIRDDGSSDKTINIINNYIKNYPKQIILINDNLGNLKSASSFMYLLSVVDADYYMFCDQDDVWLPFKIEKTFLKLQEIEKNNSNTGVLIFTDLSVVNSKLETINPSMWNYSKINPENAKDFYKTTCISSVNGCTMMFNNRIKEKVLPYPIVSRMHDWWICLNAIHYGKVDYISDVTMLYRQHEGNVLGVGQITKNHLIKKIFLLNTTVKENFKVLKMFKALNFKISYFEYFFNKIKVIIKK